jgi:hypothetical protein
MSSVVIRFHPRIRTDGIDYRCPFCGGSDGFYYIGAQAWAVCDTHRVKWWIGTALDDSWLNETPRDWIAARHFLDGFQQVYGSAMQRDDTSIAPVA